MSVTNTVELFASNPIHHLFDRESTALPLLQRIGLLEYYVSCGWGGESRFKMLLLEAVSRGDIEGASLLLDRGLCPLDEELCTVAASAGHLDILLWLREQRGCPWKAATAFQKASENLHHSVMKYIYLRASDDEILPCAVGMPH
eukprot:CAMPEP_0183300756 /NCGR_PEP_ID=MMETSP0160_2-20130417/7069_1 /TAXON_ID=2839 ORGANISM="Odontella Sinensis, Strain Grunow 1884" /NCGR_SAMPLE_ID=MMETSP0160_2 /ASSEMBLY_ACC=CAM_ASM_000250 /LENGTH=143 /DNA_ID=CAMNT_0025463237 /DNA_START=288 /DNA_END=719 /DNA_ORIENTATION=-